MSTKEPLLKELFCKDKIKPWMRISGGLHYIKNNSKPYFTITAETKHSCGCLHDEISKHAPEYKELIDYHLRDIDGVPMHVVENGWYFMGGTKWEQLNKDALKKHFNLNEEECIKLISTVDSKEKLELWVESMKPQWKEHADYLIKKFNLEIFGSNYKI